MPKNLVCNEELEALSNKVEDMFFELNGIADRIAKGLELDADVQEPSSYVVLFCGLANSANKLATNIAMVTSLAERRAALESKLRSELAGKGR